MSTKTQDEVVAEIKADLDEIEFNVVAKTHLSDLIRLGSARTTKVEGWGTGEQACALSAAALAGRAAGLI
jgi:hypothetical protein